MAEIKALSTIKVFPQVYVGFQGRRTVDDVPLGFMTPYDETAAGIKRRATVDGWAAGYGRSKTFNSVILENKPMMGFKIGRAIRRQRDWGGNATYIRVEDPRGFELEITIENLVMAMVGNIMEDGELMQECVWGRDGGKNILIPTNSEPYAEYLDTKQKLDTKLSLKDVKPGDTIKLLTGEEGVYLGGVYAIRGEHHDSKGDDRDVASLHIQSAKRYLMMYRKGVKVELQGNTTLKIGSIIKPSAVKMTAHDINQLIFDKIQAGAEVTTANYDYYSTLYGWVVSEKDAKIVMSLEEVDEMTAKASSKKFIITESNSGKTLWANHYSNFQYKGANRDYQEYDPSRNSRSYSYSYNRTKTNGYVGHPVNIDLKNGRVDYDTDQPQTHIEIADLKARYLVKYELTTATGQTYSFHL